MKKRLLAMAALLCAAALNSASAADSFYRVSLNTSALIAHPAGSFFLDFQLNDGSGTGNANNSVFLSGFNFGGGSAVGTPTYFGGASGNLATSISLTDTTPFNEFFQEFTAGSFLTFDLQFSNNAELSGVPDLFSFAILDNSLMNIPTLSPGSDAFLIVNLTESPEFEFYGSNPDLAPVAGGPALDLAAPSATAVPEPSTYGLMAAIALVGLIAWRKRRA